jgi:replicative DNA helicase
MNQQKKPKSDFTPINIDTIYGKIPPQAIEVEEAVLGACMIEREAIFKVAPILSVESFYNAEHQIIFNPTCNI